VEKPKAAPEEFEKMDHYERLALFGRKPKVMPATYSGPYHDGMRDFTGLIGAHSVYSRSKDHPYLPGRGTVKEYCNAAKNCGYSFIVFTEIFENMSREKWDALVADCKAESNDDFVAIAGIEIKDTFGVTWIAFDLTRWPDAEWLDESGTMIGNSPGFYFGLGHGMMEFVSRYLIDSDRSFFKPWEAKFYSGIEIMAYDRGRFLLSDTFDSYVKCQSNDFNIIPITTQRLYSPLEVRGPLGVLTHVRANGAGEIPLKFRYTWYKERDVYVSSGPELTQWTMENGRGSIREEEWRVKLAVKSDAPLKSVVVYDRDRIFRRFLPDGNEFQTTIAGYHDKQYFLLVVAEDVKGGKLVSSALYASDGRQSQYMCTDLQNTINGCWGVKPNGEQVFYPGLGYGVTGWDQINVSVAQPDLLPRTGFEFGYGSWGFSSSGNLPGMDGNCWGMAARDMAFSTGDCNILRDVFDTTLVDNFPSEITSLETVCRHIGYTPRMGGLNIHRAQHSVTLLRDYKLPEGQESQFLSCMRGGFADGHFPTYVIVDEFGRKTTAPRDNNTSLDVILRPGSYFASFPYMWGSFAIMPRSGPVHLRVRGGAWEVGHDVTSDLDKGAKFLADIVFICGKFGTEDEADFDHFREVFGMAGAPLYDYEITRGSLLSTRYMFMVQAESGWAEANIGQANMGSDLPINVYGLNENWDAGMLNLDTGELRRVGVFESTAILSQNIDHRALRFACGNLVTCDDPDVALNIFQREGKWSIDAHNRSSGAVKTRVRTAPWLKGVAPSLDRVVEIPAGSTVTVSL
jgi:hypothetical protein